MEIEYHLFDGYNGSMKMAVLCIYVIFSMIDSYASEHEKSRICKVFLIPLLVLLLVLSSYRNVFFYPALFMCWLGDLLLIRKTETRKLLGMLGFLAGHVLYSLFFLEKIDHLHVFASVPYIAVSILYLWKNLKLMKKKQIIPSCIYLFAIIFMSYLSFVSFLENSSIGTCLTWIGTVFFLVSDTLISRQMFLNEPQRGVMETYALAQLLIVTGVLYGI